MTDKRSGFLRGLTSFGGKSTAASSESRQKDPFMKPIDLNADCSTEDLRIGLLQLFLCYCPTQIMTVPKMVSKFRSIGKQALAETQKRFEQMPLPGEVYAVLRTCRRTRLCLFYAFHAPDNMALVDEVLDRYRGYDDELWAALIDKYGPERPPHELFEDWEERESQQKSQEGNALSGKDDARFRRGMSIQAEGRTSLEDSVVFSTENIEGKLSTWHRDPEQVARDWGKKSFDGLLDNSLSSPSSLASSGHLGSFAMFSPASPYPDSVIRRAQSIMLREGEVLSPLSSPSPQKSQTASSAGEALDPGDVDMILSAAGLGNKALCPSGGWSDTDLPPLPNELHPEVIKSPVLNQSILSNGSFLSSPSRPLRRRQTMVSFVLGSEGISTPHHQPGATPPRALVPGSPEQGMATSPLSGLGPLALSSSKAHVNASKLSAVTRDDFARL